MRIGIIGSGKIGGTLARLFARAGNEVAIANSRGPDSLRELVEELGERAHATTVEEATAFGDVVILAIPWRLREELPAGERFAGKVVVDAMNPYGAGGVIDIEPSTSSEEVARLMPEARLVKAFNTIYFQRLAENGRPREPLAEREVIFVAGDDEEGKRLVSELIEQIGFAPYDTGTLAEGGRRQQPGSPIYNIQLSQAEADRHLGEMGGG